MFRLGMHQGRVLGLAAQIRLPPVPHNSVEKTKVGGRQRPPVERRLAGGCLWTRVRIVDRDDAEVGVAWYRQRHTDQSLVQKQAVRSAAGLDRGDVIAGTIGAVYRAKYWIFSLRDLETLLQLRRRNAPSFAGIMTGGAAPVVGPQFLKKWIRKFDRAQGQRPENTAGIAEGQQIRKTEAREGA